MILEYELSTKLYYLGNYSVYIELGFSIEKGGAQIVKVDFPSASKIISPLGWDWEFSSGQPNSILSEFSVVRTEFYHSLRTYLSKLSDNKGIRSLENIITFNIEHTTGEGGIPGTHPAWPTGQDNFDKCIESKNWPEEIHREALEHIRQKSREEGIDAALQYLEGENLDGLFVPLQADGGAACSWIPIPYHENLEAPDLYLNTTDPSHAAKLIERPNFNACGLRWLPKRALPYAQNFLREIVRPADPKVDIVAVHGLNPTNNSSHAEATWTAKEKLWLKDFLPITIPNARILLFGYNANVAFETSTAGVVEHAINLLNRLNMKRKGVPPDRPIIFIAHSLGGILVKRALIESKLGNKFDSIREATYGMVFFATPHRGGEFVRLGSIAAKIVRAIYPNPTNTFMEALEKDSLFADNLTHDFRNMLEDYYVLSFYETQRLEPFGIIVDKKSATLGLSSMRETTFALGLDHRSICKFDSRLNDEYEVVEYYITELAENAIKSAESRAAITAGDPQERPVSITDSRMNSNDSVSKMEANIDANIDANMDALSLVDSLSAKSPGMSVYESTEYSRNSLTSPSTISIGENSAAAAKASNAMTSPNLTSSIFARVGNPDGRKFINAAEAGDKDLIKKMLDKGQAVDTSGVWNGMSALAEASRNGHVACVKLLLDHGANPAFHVISTTKIYGSKDNTRLSLAAGKGQLGTMRLLLDTGRYSEVELNAAHFAASIKNRSDALKLLSEYGAGRY
ncbi:hypothetical protein G7Y89_g11628 [Cudoniella acicularis]|uniref:DUF676 domain-containing protein n=1 Tax=Cudoniella acicularis TaxID=354080 RepID=A0A8H4VXU7_9HELO|nr:hypothetical protein G7Y89_g11628 [Cudoniella acicularis]